jgi:hypothetical protein
MTDDPSSSKAESGSSGDASSERAGESKRKKQLMGAGVAVGIGSAAIVAALLYANRGRRADKGEP